MLLGLHVNRVHIVPELGKPATMSMHIEAARLQAENEGIELKAVAMFVAGPRKQDNLIAAREGKELKDYIKSTGLLAIAHGTYADYPWSGNPHAAAFMRLEAETCHAVGISGMVVHLPNKPAETVLKYLPRIYPKTDTTIYLEMVAISPAKSMYESPAKIRGLFAAIRKAFDPTLMKTGLCVDTAHLWSCGVDISSREGAERWLLELESYADVIPAKKIMIHLNDSVYELGAGRDAHAPLAEGKIWGAYKDRLRESGLAAFVTYADNYGLPVILERKPVEALACDYRVLYGLTETIRISRATPP